MKEVSKLQRDKVTLKGCWKERFRPRIFFVKKQGEIELKSFQRVQRSGSNAKTNRSFSE